MQIDRGTSGNGFSGRKSKQMSGKHRIFIFINGLARVSFLISKDFLSKVLAVSVLVLFVSLAPGLAASDETMERQTLAALTRILNDRLPVDVRVHDMEVVSPAFNVMTTQ